MVKVFFSPSHLTYCFVLEIKHRRHLFLHLVNFLPYIAPCSIFILPRKAPFQSTVACLFPLKPVFFDVVCSFVFVASKVCLSALRKALSFTGEAASSECGQTFVPWDVSLLSINHTPGVGKLLFFVLQMYSKALFSCSFQSNHSLNKSPRLLYNTCSTKMCCCFLCQ